MIIAILSFILSSYANAKVIIYPSADFKTLQQAIDNSNNGDVIQVQPGRYKESATIVEKAILIVGDSDKTVFDNPHTFLKLVGRVNLQLSNIKLKNGFEFFDISEGNEIKIKISHSEFSGATRVLRGSLSDLTVNNSVFADQINSITIENFNRISIERSSFYSQLNSAITLNASSFDLDRHVDQIFQNNFEVNQVSISECQFFGIKNGAIRITGVRGNSDISHNDFYNNAHYDIWVEDSNRTLVSYNKLNGTRSLNSRSASLISYNSMIKIHFNEWQNTNKGIAGYRCVNSQSTMEVERNLIEFSITPITIGWANHCESNENLSGFKINENLCRPCQPICENNICYEPTYCDCEITRD